MSIRAPQFRIEGLPTSEIFRYLDNRQFAVPRLQREFVWTGKKAAELLDSIYRGLTIGSLLVWETHSNNSDWLRQELNLLPPFDKTNDQVWYLIDGQQRLTVLHQVRQGQCKRNSKDRQVDFGKIVFALEPNEKGEPCFSYRQPVAGRYISVSEILSNRWRHHFRKYSKARYEKIRRCRTALLDYRLPIVFLRTKSLEDVRETFLRINSGGTKVDAADEAFARASRFDLRAHVQSLRNSLDGFEGLNTNVILQGFSFVCGKLEVGKKVNQTTVKEWEEKIRDNEAARAEFDKLWSKYSESVSKAVNFLRQEFKVFNTSFLPSENMLAVLPYFFWLNGNPTSAQKRELRKWFWFTGTGGRYSGSGQWKKVAEDVRFLKRLSAHHYAKFTCSDKTPVSEIGRTLYSRNTSLGKAFLCLLAKGRPRRLMGDGELSVDVVSGKTDKKNKHHIFPKNLLAKRGFKAKEYNSIVNICFLPTDENTSIGDHHPKDYIGVIKGKRGFPAKMDSHLIPHKAQSAIWTHDVRRAYRQFRKERSTAIRAAFKKAAGVDLFRDEA